MKVFPDTNVLLAAFATRGLCADLLRTLLAEHEVIIGEPVLVELRRNLARKLRIPANRIGDIVDSLAELDRAPSVAAPEEIAGIDAEDVQVLHCAHGAGVDVLVTGDRALLDLGRFKEMPIVAPRELWERLRLAGKSG